MPALDNPRHERFCQLVASGKSQSAAYIEAGYESQSPNATASSLVSANLSVAERIAELQRPKALSLARKRELLEEIAEGKRASKRVVLADGSEEETFEPIKAIELDAKLAGELDERARQGPILINLALLGLDVSVPMADTGQPRVIECPIPAITATESKPVNDDTQGALF